MTAIATTLPAVLRERARQAPDRLFIVDVEDRRVTYQQTVEMMSKWAAAYASIGTGRGEYVVTMQLNTIESLASWLGLSSIGAIEVPINVDYRGDMLVHALNLTQARTLLVESRFFARVAEVSDRLTHIQQVVVLGPFEHSLNSSFEIVREADFLAPRSDEPIYVDSAPWDIAVILFTSGTTGPSKAVRVPWAQLHAAASATFPIQDLDSRDVFYNPGPTYHKAGKSLQFLAALVGGQLVMRPFISQSSQPSELQKYGVTTVTFPLPMAWLDDPPRPDDAKRALRNIVLPYPIPRIEEFKRRFGCRSFGVFSMTELSCPVADPTWDSAFVNEKGHFSCGKVRSGYPGYEARIVDDWDRPVAPGMIGELIVRTSEPWTTNAGYLNNPGATAEAWRNGWFHTGDSFYQDEDGRLYFQDRKKDSIRRKGENISSFEVEAIIRGNPEISDCAAVAAKRAEAAGADEDVRLFVVRISGSSLSADELLRWLVPRMPRFMIPRFVEFVDELPRTPTLKVQKAELRRRPLHQDVWDRESAKVALPR